MYWEHAGHKAVRHGDYKALLPRRENTWQLYHLADDRQETNNLAATEPTRVAEMAAKWQSWAQRVGVTQQAKPAPATGSAKQERERSPKIANQEIRLQATIDAETPHGVVIAQGGDRHGYALHFADGKPTFDVRRGGTVTRLSVDTPLSGRVHVEASLTKTKMTLTVGQNKPVSCDSPGLIPSNPLDPLSVGHDSRTAAGDYTAPNRFNGKVLEHQVTTQGVDK